MKAKNKIVRLRKNNPFMSTAKIASQVGVTRVYAHQVLKKNNLETNPPKSKKVVYCKVCGEITNSSRSIHKGECTFKWNYLKLTCSWCSVPFYRHKKIIKQNYRLKLKNVYCSRQCFQTARTQKIGNKQRTYIEVGTKSLQNVG